ncbi:site-specific DNA-methyltransferase [Candidatus Poribacteria bacterium]|nr:site-specific DNA-methyltransferase [Candidatus Poribacteria bacterium]
MNTNVLYYGDNLDILRKYIDDESVDLIYIDPPFNSNQAYNIIFSEPNGTSSQAQIRAFDDTWHWTEQTEQTYSEIIDTAPPKIVEGIKSFRSFLGEMDMMAYLTMMTPRLIELHRVLKPTGSFYLHCDSTASHYLKVVLDQMFGIKNFRNEIVWCYSGGGIPKKDFPRKHDIIFRYTKTDDYTYNAQYRPYTEGTLQRGRTQVKGKYSQLNPLGTPVTDWWNDIKKITSPTDPEKLGYPTQKSEALLERIIKAGSSEGEIVLDAFTGCGTTIAVAQHLKRHWIGIDITHLAIAVIKHRLGDDVKYTVIGEPVDVASARALAQQDRYQFQWWVLSLIKARPVQEQKKGADEGVDGVIYFQDADPDKPKKKITQKIVVQVKNGKVSVRDIRELKTVVANQKAIIGVFITLENPTEPMVTEAVRAGYYERWGQKYPKIQIRTVEELLQSPKIEYPQTLTNMSFKKTEQVETTQRFQMEIEGLD